MDLDEGVVEPVLIALDKDRIVELLIGKTGRRFHGLTLELLGLLVFRVCTFGAYLTYKLKYLRDLLFTELQAHLCALVCKVVLEDEFIIIGVKESVSFLNSDLSFL